MLVFLRLGRYSFDGRWTMAKKKSANSSLPSSKRTSRKVEAVAEAIQAFQVSGVPLCGSGTQQKIVLRDLLQMPRNVFCRMVNVSERAIADAESGKVVKKLVRPYNELKRLVDALEEIVERHAIGPWFLVPNPMFDDSRPIDLIERGEMDRLWQMVYQLRSGVAD